MIIIGEYLNQGGPVIDGVQRMVYSGRQLFLQSYTGIPTFSIKSKAQPGRASAFGRWGTFLNLNIRVWNKSIADTRYDFRSVSIAENKRFTVLSSLREVRSWFDTTKYPDLYVINNDNELEFNFDYKNLYKHIQIPTSKRIQAIIITPGIVTIENEKYEGVFMYVNTRTVWAELTIFELDELIDAIDRFDYQLEPLLNLSIIFNGYRDESQ